MFISKLLFTMLTISTVNVNGLRGKLPALTATAAAHKIDIIAVQESKVDSSILSASLHIPGYEIFRKDRTLHGGGVVIYARQELCAHAIRLRLAADREAVAVRLPSGLLITSVYRPPNGSINTFYTDLSDGLAEHTHQKLVICGDFNADTDKDKKVVQDFCDSLGLEQMVNSPTHNQRCIDHLYCSSDMTTSPVIHMAPLEKKHEQLVFSVDDRTPTVPSCTPGQSYRLYSSANWERINDDIHLADLSVQLRQPHLDCNGAWLLFKSTLLSALDRHVPTRRQGRKKPKQAPWMTPSLLFHIREKNRAFRQYKSTGADHAVYRRLLKKCRKETARCRKEFAEEKFTNSTTRDFWQQAKLLLKVPVKGVANLVTANGSKATSDQEKASTLLEQFKGSAVSANCTAAQPAATTTMTTHPPPPVCPLSWVRYQLRRINPRKSTGPDNIPAVLLRKAADAIAPGLTTLINLSLSSGDLPDDWKMAIITPLRKAGTDATNPASYRPISLTSIPSKICERWVKKCLTPTIEPHLPDKQYGFRERRGTCEALLDAEASLMSRIEQAPAGQKCAAMVSFDVKGAFDNIAHKRVLHHLAECGVDDWAINWYANFLRDRQQAVRVNNTTSDFSTINCGVPQGTVSGPLLYTVATHHLQDVQLKGDATLICYADDVAMIQSAGSTQQLQQLQENCTAVNSFFQGEGLELSNKKTKLLMCQLGGQRRDDPKLMLNGQQIEHCESIKYLGVTFDTRLTFTDHIRSAVCKSRRALGAIGSVLRKWRLNRTIAKIWQTTILPGMTYGLATTFGHTKKDCELLDKVQRLAARYSLNDYISDYQALLRELHWPSITDLCNREHVRLGFDYSHGYRVAPAGWICKTQGVRRSVRLAGHDHQLQLTEQNLRWSTSRGQSTGLQQLINKWNSAPEQLIKPRNRKQFLSDLRQQYL